MREDREPSSAVTTIIGLYEFLGGLIIGILAIVNGRENGLAHIVILFFIYGFVLGLLGLMHYGSLALVEQKAKSDLNKNQAYRFLTISVSAILVVIFSFLSTTLVNSILDALGILN